MEEDTQYISFDESNVEDSFIIKVIQEVIGDNASIVLNKDQIKNELYNILYEKYDSNKIFDKINGYLVLFDKIQQILNIKFNNTLPIIAANKHSVINERVNQGTIDKEYENTNFIETVSLNDYLEKYNNNNRNKNTPYQIISSALYALSKPFTNHEDDTILIRNKTISNDTHAIYNGIFNHQYEEVKLIGPIKLSAADLEKNINLYTGDNINISGFYNKVNDDKECMFVDFNIYIQKLKTLSVDDKIIVLLNEYLENLDYNIKEFTSTITDIDSHGNIFFKDPLGKIHKYIINSYNPFFIYKHDHQEYKYSKYDLLNNNIAFKLIQNDTNNELLYQFITPQTVNEILFITQKNHTNIYNLDDIDKLLASFNVSSDNITVWDLPILSAIFRKNHIRSKSQDNLPLFYEKKFKTNVHFLDFKKNSPLLKAYSEYIHTNKFSDTELNRFLYIIKNKHDGGYHYIFSYILKKLNENYADIEAINKEYYKLNNDIKVAIDNIIQNKLDTSKKSCEKQRIIAKTYNSIKDLLNDNKKTDILFDKEHDKTKYDIKNRIFENNPNVQDDKTKLKHLILKELATIYPNYTKEQLDIESKYILEGSRKVNVNDYAILNDSMSSSSILYVYQKIQDGFIWVKVGTLPYKICTDKIESFDDITKGDACIYNTFEEMCQKADQAKYTMIYRNLLSKLEYLDDIIKLAKQFDDQFASFNKVLDHFKYIINIDPSKLRNRAFDVYEHEDDIDYDDFTGDVNYIDVDKILNNIEFDNYLTPLAPTIQSNNQNKKHFECSDILDYLLEFSSLDLEEPFKEFILAYNNDKNPAPNHAKAVDDERKRLFAAVNKTLYESNPKYKTLFDTKLKEKLDTFLDELNSKYFLSSTITITSMLILTIMVIYPDALFKNILPKCLKYLEYVGHPYTSKDPNKSLSKYFACIIKSTANETDVRFSKLLDKDINQIDELFKKEISNILEQRYDIKTRLEENIPNIQNNKITYFNLSNFQTFNNFLPFMDINKTDFTIPSNIQKKKQDALGVIKAIYNKIKTSKILAYSIINTALLNNSCCIEKLNNQYNYFDFFKDDIKHDSKFVYNYDFSSYRCKKHIVNDENIDIFSLFNVEMPPDTMNIDLKDDSDINIISKLNILSSIEDSFFESFKNNDIWWNETFYPELFKLFRILKEALEKYSDNVPIDKLDILEKKCILVSTVYNKVDTKNTLIKYITRDIKKTLLQFINKYKPISEIDPDNKFHLLLESTSKNSQFSEYSTKFITLINKYITTIEKLDINDNTDSEVHIKNISILTFILIEIIIKIIHIPFIDNIENHIDSSLYNKVVVTDNNNQLLRLLSSISIYLIENLVQKLEYNDTSMDLLKSSIEQLREKRKEELMNSYSVDDEERELQMQLKKIGIKDWKDLAELKTDAEEPTITSTQQETNIVNEEDANYNLTVVTGENDDIDDENDYMLVFDQVSNYT